MVGPPSLGENPEVVVFYFIDEVKMKGGLVNDRIF